MIKEGKRTRMVASDADKAGRDQLILWIKEAGLFKNGLLFSVDHFYVGFNIGLIKKRLFGGKEL
ncbi:MAG: hypothetical protein ABS960_10520 [Solibacillus isronensis]